MTSNQPPVPRALFAAVLFASVAFAGIAVALQWLRGDLDWVRDTLSHYLHGPHSLWLRAAYCVLSVAVCALALGLYRQAVGHARRGLPVGLFAVAGAGLATVAIGDSTLPRYAPLLAPLVHGVAAQAAFLCATVGMLVQSWCLARQPGWRRAAMALSAWAWLTFAALWLHVLWRETPRGLGQKAVIAMVLAWLAAVSALAWRKRGKETPETTVSRHNVAHSPTGVHDDPAF